MAAMKWDVERAGEEVRLSYGQVSTWLSLKEAQRFGQSIINASGLGGAATSSSKVAAAPAPGGKKGGKKGGKC